MKRLLTLLLLFPSLAWSSGIYNPGSGGGSGGASSLGVYVNGVQVSSPTASIGFNGTGVTSSSSGSSTTITITGGSGGGSTVTLSSFTATQPIVYNNTTGAFSATLISLSTGVTSSLATTSIAAGSLGSGVIASSVAVGSILLSGPQVTGQLPVAAGGTGTASPGLVAGTNIASITGSWPNQTINAATQSGGGTASPLAIGLGTATQYLSNISSPTAVINLNNLQFTSQLTGSSTNFVGLNPSSVTLQGPITAASLGASTLSSLSALQPVIYNSGTGQFSSTLISLSTGVMGTLPGASVSGNISGNAANITGNLAATQVAAGILGSGVIVSSIAVNGVYPASVIAGTYSNITLPGANVSGNISGNAANITGNLPTTQLSGTLQAAQEPAHTGDVTNTSGALAMTAATTQANIKNFSSALTSVSSTTFQSAVLIASSTIAQGQIGIVGSSQLNLLTISSATTGINLVSVSSTPATAPTDYLLSVSSGDGTFIFGVKNNSVTSLSGNLSFSNTSKQGIVGSTTTDSPTNGNVGEWVQATAPAVTVTTSAQFNNVASISLTAGDWDVSGVGFVNHTGTVVTSNATVVLSAFTGNTTTDHVNGDNAIVEGSSSGASFSIYSFSITSWRVSLSATTTIYLKVNETFTGTAPVATCRISARRVR